MDDLQTIKAKLKSLADLNFTSQQDLSIEYYLIINAILTNFAGQDLITGLTMYINAVLDHNISLVLARELITHFCCNLDTVEHNVSKQVTKHTYSRLQPREKGYEEQVSLIRQHLATIYEHERNWQKAIEILKGIPLDNGHRQFTLDYKLGTYLKLSRFYLEDNNVLESEAYINRAALLQVDSKNETLQLEFKVGYARLLDCRHRFIEAAQRYSDLASSEIISIDERYAALRNAITCTMLSPPGKQRSRLLASLCKDERTHSMEVFSILQKMHLERLIRRCEMEVLEINLKPHQRMILAHNCTICEHALIQHNLIAASRVYKNITFTGMGELLEIDADRAERIAGQMISDELLSGIIDQPDNVLYFDDPETLLPEWDVQVKATCDQVNHIIELMTKNNLLPEMVTIKMEMDF